MKAQDLNYKKAQLTEGVMDRIRYIVDNNAAQRVTFDDGSSLEVDLYTASAIKALHDAVNDKNKAKIEEKIGKSKEMFYKLADFAFQNVNESVSRGDILVNDDTETAKMTESAYRAKPAPSRMTIKEQPYILINKPQIGETAYAVKFTKRQPILENKEFEPGTRIHAGVGKKGGAGFTGTVVKEENGFVFFKTDTGKTYKAPKDKVSPAGGITFSEGKKKPTDVPSKHQEKIAKDTVKNPNKSLMGGPTAAEAEQMLRDKFGYSDAQIEKLKESANLTEKSVSKDQQRAAGAALAAKKGETPVSELQGASKEMYDSMTKKELEDFAGTKHKGLPEKVDEAKDYKAVDMDLIDEDSLDENAFNQAAADAALAGKKEFKFDGKTYPVEMDKETAKEISENRNDVDIESWIKEYKKRENRNFHTENVVELARLVGDAKHVELAEKIMNRHEELGYMDQKTSETRRKLDNLLWERFTQQYGDVYSKTDMFAENAGLDFAVGDINQDQMSKAVLDPDDYGPQAGTEMAKTQLHFMVYAIGEIKDCMREGYHMPDWFQNKITSIHYDMQGIHSYMEGNRRKRDMCGPISEGYVGSDYGPDAALGMARTQLSFIKYAAQDVLDCISAGTPIPEWYQNKVSNVHRAIETIYAYMEGIRNDAEDHGDEGLTTGTLETMTTVASQPPPSTGALFAGGEDETMDVLGEGGLTKPTRKKLRKGNGIPKTPINTKRATL